MIGRLATLVVALVVLAPPALAIDADEEPTDAITAWIADAAREWVDADETRPEQVVPAEVSFGVARRALEWSPLLLADPPADSWSGVSVPLRPDDPAARVPRPPRHPEALPVGSDPVAVGLVVPIDTWLIPVTQAGRAVGVLEVTFKRGAPVVAATWSPAAGAAVIDAPHHVVHDPSGWIGIDLPTVRALDDAARERIAGEVPIDTYLEVLAEAAAEPGTQAARYRATTPIIVTISALAALFAALLFARWLRIESDT
ncbi:hypothetical protein BSZ39_00455 [Bowdeniella nasicola]|uniref:Uncharacterized protein n=1 Tax=Bowdeniella nasicola TaxID=208480 RepID=A0A1Q5Q5Q9_9ACTO|nr:hypothetical protein BSZ39_00455 [Bowdeniella nasicola]